MAISRVEIKDFLVFKGEFAADFCPGVNVLIGGNGTGKTTLLREMYRVASRNPHYFPKGTTYGDISGYTFGQLSRYTFDELEGIHQNNVIFNSSEITSAVYIPEKDILEHTKGLLTFMQEKQTGFSQIYADVIIKAQDAPTKRQTETQKQISGTISNIIGGYVEWDLTTGSFYTVRIDGNKIPFTYEASGYKKLGLLGLLVTCGQLEPGTVLFWDEPENSLNPELMPALVDILLKLSRNGVQIFIATHSYTLARYFDVKKGETADNTVIFYNLIKESDGHIAVVSSPECRNLPKNILDEADEQLYKAVVANAMRGNGR